jgi:hypothetical protein
MWLVDFNRAQRLRIRSRVLMRSRSRKAGSARSFAIERREFAADRWRASAGGNRTRFAASRSASQRSQSLALLERDGRTGLPQPHSLGGRDAASRRRRFTE